MNPYETQIVTSNMSKLAAGFQQSIKNIEATLHKKINTIKLIAFLEHPKHKYKGISYEWNLKRFFPEEYALSAALIRQFTSTGNATLSNCQIEVSELLIAQEWNLSIKDVERLLWLLSNMVKIMTYYFMKEFPTDTVAGHSTLEHLKFLSYRILVKQIDESHYDEWGRQTIQKHPAAFRCTQNIVSFVKKHEQFSLSETEQLFLTIHLQLCFAQSIT